MEAEKKEKKREKRFFYLLLPKNENILFFLQGEAKNRKMPFFANFFTAVFSFCFPSLRSKSLFDKTLPGRSGQLGKERKKQNFLFFFQDDRFTCLRSSCLASFIRLFSSLLPHNPKHTTHLLGKWIIA